MAHPIIAILKESIDDSISLDQLTGVNQPARFFNGGAGVKKSDDTLSSAAEEFVTLRQKSIAEVNQEISLLDEERLSEFVDGMQKIGDEFDEHWANIKNYLQSHCAAVSALKTDSGEWSEIRSNLRNSYIFYINSYHAKQSQDSTGLSNFVNQIFSYYKELKQNEQANTQAVRQFLEDSVKKKLKANAQGNLKNKMSREMLFYGFSKADQDRLILQVFKELSQALPNLTQKIDIFNAQNNIDAIKKDLKLNHFDDKTLKKIIQQRLKKLNRQEITYRKKYSSKTNLDRETFSEDGFEYVLERVIRPALKQFSNNTDISLIKNNLLALIITTEDNKYPDKMALLNTQVSAIVDFLFAKYNLDAIKQKEINELHRDFIKSYKKSLSANQASLKIKHEDMDAVNPVEKILFGLSYSDKLTMLDKFSKGDIFQNQEDQETVRNNIDSTRRQLIKQSMERISEIAYAIKAIRSLNNVLAKESNTNKELDILRPYLLEYAAIQTKLWNNNENKLHQQLQSQDKIDKALRDEYLDACVLLDEYSAMVGVSLEKVKNSKYNNILKKHETSKLITKKKNVNDSRFSLFSSSSQRKNQENLTKWEDLLSEPHAQVDDILNNIKDNYQKRNGPLGLYRIRNYIFELYQKYIKKTPKAVTANANQKADKILSQYSC